MVVDARRENGTGVYVTKEEHQTSLEQLTNRFLESHQELSENDGQIMAELSEIREDIIKLSKGEELERRKIRNKLRSLPDLVSKAVEEDKEITAITNLKKEVASSKKRAKRLKDIVIAVVVGAGGLILGEVVLHMLKVL